MNLSEVSIMSEPVYRIRRTWIGRTGRRQRKYFLGTRTTCARRIAWWYVWDRYSGVRAEDWEHRTGFDCACEEDYYGNAIDFRDCPIHDRETGYLVRLATRMARNVEANFDRLIASAEATR